MSYIMNDDKGYIEFHKDPNNKKKFKYNKNKIKMTKNGEIRRGDNIV